MRPSSSAEMTPRPESPSRGRSSNAKLPIASSSRSCCTGTPRTVPRAAQATAASSSSCGGSRSPWMQLRRVTPPRGASSSSSSSSPPRAFRTSSKFTTKPKPRSRASCDSCRPAITTSHGLPASFRHSTFTSVMLAPSRQHNRLHSSRRAWAHHATLTALSWHIAAASTS
eukprot:scaffold81747_cov68-Phaeocystis_antarctica.AAC.3